MFVCAPPTPSPPPFPVRLWAWTQFFFKLYFNTQARPRRPRAPGRRGRRGRPFTNPPHFRLLIEFLSAHRSKFDAGRRKALNCWLLVFAIHWVVGLTRLLFWFWVALSILALQLNFNVYSRQSDCYHPYHLPYSSNSFFYYEYEQVNFLLSVILQS